MPHCYFLSKGIFYLPDMPPSVSSLYRSNFTSFWIDDLPMKMSRYAVDPLFEYTSTTTPKPKPTHRNLGNRTGVLFELTSRYGCYA